MDTKADKQRRRNILIVDDTVELAQSYKELLRRFVSVSGESGYQKFQPCLRAVEPPVFTRSVPFEKLFAELESFWARGG